jgi:hypothetical protein
VAVALAVASAVALVVAAVVAVETAVAKAWHRQRLKAKEIVAATIDAEVSAAVATVSAATTWTMAVGTRR